MICPWVLIRRSGFVMATVPDLTEVPIVKVDEDRPLRRSEAAVPLAASSERILGFVCFCKSTALYGISFRESTNHIAREYGDVHPGISFWPEGGDTANLSAPLRLPSEMCQMHGFVFSPLVLRLVLSVFSCRLVPRIRTGFEICGLQRVCFCIVFSSCRRVFIDACAGVLARAARGLVTTPGIWWTAMKR